MNTVGWVAAHLADTVSWADVIVKEDSFDVAPPDGPPHANPEFDTSAEIVQAFEANLQSAIGAIRGADDSTMGDPWTLKQGGNDLFTLPRAAVIKTFLLNHVIHHRAFLIAYLRMNGIKCPGMYD